MATTASEPATGVTDDLTLAQVDPEVYAAIQGEATRLRETIQLIPSENYPSAAVLEATGSVMTTKYAEGYPQAALLPGLRLGGSGGGPGPAAGAPALRRRPRQRAAPLRLVGQHGGLLRRLAAGRHGAGHGPERRRAPDPRLAGQLLLEAVPLLRLRRRPADGAHRLRPGGQPGPRAPAEDDRRGRHRLPQALRLGAVPGDRGRGRGAAAGGHGPHLRPRRRRRASLACALRRLLQLEHAQDPARARAAASC